MIPTFILTKTQLIPFDISFFEHDSYAKISLSISFMGQSDIKTQLSH